MRAVPIAPSGHRQAYRCAPLSLLLARLEVDEPGQHASVGPVNQGCDRAARRLPVFLGVDDVQDVFHRFRFSDELSTWFWLGTFHHDELACRTLTIDPSACDSQGYVDVCWGSLPMGFTWSMYFCQFVGEELMGGLVSLSR